ncbi:MAG: hypothetical protein AB1714_10370 [Acidobacteriota bacterium]
MVQTKTDSDSSYGAGPRKVTAFVDPEIHRALRIHIGKHDLSMQDLVNKILTWYVYEGPGSEKPETTVKFLDYSVTAKRQE